MAYQNYYNPYPQQYYQPPMQDQLAQLRQGQYQQQPQQMPAQPAASNNPIIWVQGEEGAKAYMVAAGNSVMLMDSEASTFYLKSTDASGMPMPLRIFDYTERAATPKQPAQPQIQSNIEYVTRQEFDALAARLEAMTVKEKSTKATKQKEETNDG